MQIDVVEGTDLFVIRGNPRDVARVMEVIRQLEELSEVSEPRVEVIPLEHIDSQVLSLVLRQLFAAQPSDGQYALRPYYGPLLVQPLGRPNAVLLAGAPSTVGKAAELVDQLDVAGGAGATEVRVFKLRHALATDLAPVLQRAIREVGQAVFGDGWDAQPYSPQWVETARLMMEATRRGELVGAKLLGTSMFVTIRPEEWFNGGDPTLPFRTDQIGGHWAFIVRSSLNAFTFRHGIRGGTTTFAFDMSATWWSLYDACVWAATRGDTTNEAVAAGNVEDVGARLLFGRLAELEASAPEVRAIATLTEMRTPVPWVYWERAHTGWLGGGTGHWVRFSPSAEREGEVCAELTPKAALEPAYVNLQIRRADVIELFPMAAPKKRGNKERDDTDWLLEVRAKMEATESTHRPGSLRAVCLAVAAKMPGEQSVESAAARLAKKARKEFPTLVKRYAPRNA